MKCHCLPTVNSWPTGTEGCPDFNRSNESWPHSVSSAPTLWPFSALYCIDIEAIVSSRVVGCISIWWSSATGTTTTSGGGCGAGLVWQPLSQGRPELTHPALRWGSLPSVPTCPTPIWALVNPQYKLAKLRNSSTWGYLLSVPLALDSSASLGH